MKLFISYAREDQQIAERLFNDLRKLGLNPWIDSEGIRAGDRWETTIFKVIQESSFFLALCSSKSMSKHGFIQKELKKALDRSDEFSESEPYIIPIRIDDCEITHEKLSKIHYVDLFPYEEGLIKILSSVLTKKQNSKEDILNKSGFLNIYVPDKNADRIIPKQETIKNANKYIKLIADTGHSFLSERMVFQPCISEFLNKKHITLQIILLSPWCEDSLLIALKEKEHLISQSEIDNIIQKISKNSSRGFDAINLIEKSRFKKKFDSSIDMYLKYKSEFDKKINLRLSQFMLPATILMNETKGFFEPYIKGDLNMRFNKLMISFELEFDQSSFFYSQAQDHFDFFWKLSEPYESFSINAEGYLKSFKNKYL